eukprot:g5056.t1
MSRWQSAVVLVLIPFFCMILAAYQFSCLPLEMEARGWPLLRLGLAQSAGMGCRIMIPLVAVRFVPLERLLLPLAAFPLATGMLCLAWPQSQPLLLANVFALLLMPSRSAQQAAAVLTWPRERTQALGLFEAVYTIGYCLSSLWGSSLYTLGEAEGVGGWSLCVRMQVLVLALVAAAQLTVPMLRPDRACGWCMRTGAAASAAGAGASAAGAGAGAKEGGAGDSAIARPARDRDSHGPGRRALVVFLCFSSTVHVFAYGCEWCVYLLYFSSEFRMSTLQIGVAQMAGDVGGALLLLGLVQRRQRQRQRHGQRQHQRRPEGRSRAQLHRLAVGMSALGLMYALCFVAFASPVRWLAVSGQVLMGTCYVLLMQGTNLLTEWLGELDGGDSGKQYQALADACFVVGCFTSSSLAYIVYEGLGVTWVMRMAAMLVGVYYLAFALLAPLWCSWARDGAKACTATTASNKGLAEVEGQGQAQAAHQQAVVRIEKLAKALA